MSLPDIVRDLLLTNSLQLGPLGADGLSALIIAIVVGIRFLRR